MGQVGVLKTPSWSSAKVYVLPDAFLQFEAWVPIFFKGCFFIQPISKDLWPYMSKVVLLVWVTYVLANLVITARMIRKYKSE